MSYNNRLFVAIAETRFDVPLANQQVAHLIRLCPEVSNGQAVFMLHGLMDNANCFHNATTQTGLGYALARQGYDVYMAELRGRHLNNKALSRLEFGIEEAIAEDLPLLIATMNKTAKLDQQIWIGQGFGSVLLASYLARNTSYLKAILGLVHFSPFREIQTVGEAKRFWVDWLHGRGINLLAKKLGYVPAVKLKLGRSNENLAFYQQALDWLSTSWQGKDGFDYAVEVKKLAWPPSLYFASLHPTWRASEVDARAFMFDLGDHDARLIKLGRSVGNQKNYKRSELCLHKNAEQDYYPLLLNWLQALKVN